MANPTDKELVAWLRDDHWKLLLSEGVAKRLLYVANRLEKLTQPDKKCPLTETRVAEIRQWVDVGMLPPGPATISPKDVRDLLAYADWLLARAILAESVLQDIIQERGFPELPPHIETYKENRRLRAALEEIARMVPQGDERAGTIARKALGAK